MEYCNVTGEDTCHSPQWRQQVPSELLLFWHSALLKRLQWIWTTVNMSSPVKFDVLKKQYF